MSNLEFIVHPTPVANPSQADSKYWRDFEVMRVKWKGLDFLTLIYTEDQMPSLSDDEDDDEISDTSESKKYFLQCLMPEFQVFHGDYSSVEEAKEGALKAERLLTTFASKIFRLHYKRGPSKEKVLRKRVGT